MRIIGIELRWKGITMILPTPVENMMFLGAGCHWVIIILTLSKLSCEEAWCHWRYSLIIAAVYSVCLIAIVIRRRKRAGFTERWSEYGQVRLSRILPDRIPKGHVSDDNLTGLLLQSLLVDFKFPAKCS